MNGRALPASHEPQPLRSSAGLVVAHERTAPRLLCPACGATEPSAFFGKTTRALVPLSSRHFRDERGFLFCARCGVVWNALHRAPAEAEAPSAETTANQRLGINPGFDARDAEDRERYADLARMESKVRGASDKRARNARFRVNDAATMCEALHLAHDVREAILHHVATFAMNADLRRVAKTKTRPRAEAFTIATVALVCERFGVACDLPLLFESIAFTVGEAHITATEYRAAYAGAHSWYSRHLWRTSK